MEKIMDKLYIVIPAYNEEEMITTVIDQWHQVAVSVGPESRLVVIDDGSKDHTYEIIKNCEKKYPQLIALTKENEDMVLRSGTVINMPSSRGRTIFSRRIRMVRHCRKNFLSSGDAETVPQ